MKYFPNQHKCFLSFSSPNNYRLPARTVKLSQCVRENITAWFTDIDLNQVNIHDDGLPYLVEKFNTLDNGVGAVTFGNDIYFPRGQFDSHTHVGISTICHELYHVSQYKRLGKAGFLKEYVESYVRNVEKQLDSSNNPMPKIPDSLLQPTLDITGWKAYQFVEWLGKFKDWIKKNTKKIDLDKAYREIQLEKDAYEFGGQMRTYLEQVAIGRGEKPDANGYYYICK